MGLDAVLVIMDLSISQFAFPSSQHLYTQRSKVVADFLKSATNIPETSFCDLTVSMILQLFKVLVKDPSLAP
jgi:hypothetical protein